MINPGDIVALKSGSPDMTVSSTCPVSLTAECWWFSNGGMGGMNFLHKNLLVLFSIPDVIQRPKPGDIVRLRSGSPEMRVLSEEKGRMHVHFGVKDHAIHPEALVVETRVLQDQAQIPSTQPIFQRGDHVRLRGCSEILMIMGHNCGTAYDIRYPSGEVRTILAEHLMLVSWRELPPLL